MTTSPPLPRADEAFPCAGPDVDRELFFEENNPARIDSAKAYCRRCPFRDACLNWALTVGEQGIWGATTADERKALRRSRHIKVTRIKVTGLVPHGPTKDNLVPHGTSVGVESHRKRYTPLCDDCQVFDDEGKGVAS